MTRPLASARFPFSPFPTGWYAVAFSHELPKLAVRARRFAGQEVVLFRTASGEAAVLPAHCPHLGAHFAEGGRVEGESLRCPMHGFRFDARGRCVATGYDTKPPPTCNARALRVLEQNGAVLAWHDALGREPAWQPPAVDMHGFGPLHTKVFRELASHPQETTENSVDLGHLSVVHGYRNVRTLAELQTDGAYLTTRYAVSRGALLPGTRRVDTEFTIHAHGLGYSFVDVDVISHGLHTRHFVFATPTDGERIDLHLGAAVGLAGRLSSRVPTALVDGVFGALAFRAFLSDVRQDLPIWSRKNYVQPPALAQGDGPIGRYRSWTRQFYPDEAAQA